jgi:hypothetical protein
LNFPLDAESNRHRDVAQDFLDNFVRRNVHTSPVGYDEHLWSVHLDFVDQILYFEIASQLNSWGIQGRKGNKFRQTDRETRLDRAVSECKSIEEALSKLALGMDRADEGKQCSDVASLLAERRRESERLLADIRKAVPQAKIAEPKVFIHYQKSIVEDNSVGDVGVASTFRTICEETPPIPTSSTAPKRERKCKSQESDDEDKSPKKKRIERNLTAALKIMVDQYAVSTRSLRYVENAQRLREGRPVACSNAACVHCTPGRKTTSDFAVSSSCGHAICRNCFEDMAARSENACPTLGCAADMKAHNLLWSHKIAKCSIEPASHGAKIRQVVNLLREIERLDQKAILFCQYEEHLDAIRIALEEEDIAASVVSGSSRFAGKEIAEFRDPENKKTVIVLNASAETSAGLNLQNANHVIFLSPLLRMAQYQFEADVPQAIGRARREWQPERTVHVYHMLAVDTIEVDILEHRERRATPLTQRGVYDVATQNEALKPKAGKSNRKGTMITAKEIERTHLVCEEGNFSLQPLSWLACYGQERSQDDGGSVRPKGRHRSIGWDHFGSLVQWSNAYVEDE